MGVLFRFWLVVALDGSCGIITGNWSNNQWCMRGAHFVQGIIRGFSGQGRRDLTDALFSCQTVVGAHPTGLPAAVSSTNGRSNRGYTRTGASHKACFSTLKDF